MEFDQNLQGQQQTQQQDGQTVQSQQGDQGGQGGQQQQDSQPIDYEKAYKNLEPDYTRKSQKLAQLEAWERFQEQTGITATQALQQLEQYQGVQQQQSYPQQPNAYQQQHQQAGGYPPYQDPFQQQFYEDPRVSQMEQQLQEMRQAQQVENLRKRFPQFEEMYPDVMNLAQTQGLDIETAFGRLMVDRWDDVKANTERQVVDQIRAKGLKSVEPSNAPPGNDETANLTQEELAAARLTGVSPEEYAKMKNVKYTID